MANVLLNASGGFFWAEFQIALRLKFMLCVLKLEKKFELKSKKKGHLTDFTFFSHCCFFLYILLFLKNKIYKLFITQP